MGNQPSSKSEIPLGEHCSITREQLDSVRHIWKETMKKGDDHVGKSLYLRLFVKSLEIQAIFQEYGDGATGYEQRMQKQQKAFTQALNKIVANLEKPDVLNPYLVSLGARHAHLGAKGFQPYLWDNFKGAMLELGTEWESIASQKFNYAKMQETKTAWKNIVDYIIEMMKNGYYEEILKQVKE